jgi:hypothetical protein
MAAVDMWGSRGSRRRRQVIRWEFTLGAVGCLALGAVVLLSASTAPWLAIGAWLVCAGVNYAPLALYAHALSHPGALEAELKDVDLGPELRQAGIQQLWIAVPFAVAFAAIRQERRLHTR